MKIGAENKKELIAMIVLLAIAIPVVIWAVRTMWGGSSPASAASIPPPVSSTQKKSASVAPFRETNLDTTLRTDLLASSQKITYEGGKRNIFRMEEPPPPPPIKTIAPAVVYGPQAPPPPPPPPPINLKYFGFSNKPGEPKKAFLMEGDEIFVAKEGDIVNRHYKILQITNTSVMVEDVLTNNKQPIPLTAPATTG